MVSNTHSTWGVILSQTCNTSSVSKWNAPATTIITWIYSWHRRRLLITHLSHMGWTHHHLYRLLYIDQVIRLTNPNGYRPPRGRTPASTSITPHHRGITHLALRYHAAWHFHHRQLTSPLHAQCYTVPRSRRKTCVTVPQKHLHWVSKRQATTSRSSAEAKIITSDECLKWLQHTSHILKDLH